jgi:hypothetical protein
MTAGTRETRIGRQSRSRNLSEIRVALLVIVVVVVILVAWIGFGNLARYVLWTAGILAVILGAYSSYLRYK